MSIKHAAYSLLASVLSAAPALLACAVVPGGVATVYAGNDGSNFVRTTTFLTGSATPTRGRVSTVYYDGMLKHGYTIRYWIHNHLDNMTPSISDQNFITTINSNQPIKWAIYYSKRGIYLPYDNKTFTGTYYANIKDL